MMAGSASYCEVKAFAAADCPAANACGQELTSRSLRWPPRLIPPLSKR